MRDADADADAGYDHPALYIIYCDGRYGASPNLKGCGLWGSSGSSYLKNIYNNKQFLIYNLMFYQPPWADIDTQKQNHAHCSSLSLLAGYLYIYTISQKQKPASSQSASKSPSAAAAGSWQLTRNSFAIRRSQVHRGKPSIPIPVFPISYRLLPISANTSYYFTISSNLTWKNSQLLGGSTSPKQPGKRTPGGGRFTHILRCWSL